MQKILHTNHKYSREVWSLPRPFGLKRSETGDAERPDVVWQDRAIQNTQNKFRLEQRDLHFWNYIHRESLILFSAGSLSWTTNCTKCTLLILNWTDTVNYLSMCTLTLCWTTQTLFIKAHSVSNVWLWRCGSRERGRAVTEEVGTEGVGLTVKRWGQKG